jgi:hypothetical protein
MTAPGETYDVQLQSDPVDENGNRPIYTVDRGEYERLLELGLLINAPAEPDSPDHFSQEIADAFSDVDGPAYAAGRAAFTLRATSVPPVNPAVGDVWIS